MHAEPQQEHAWLQKLVGEWNYETEPATEGEGAGKVYRGTETVRALGGLWVVAEGQGETCGGSMETLVTLGYDPEKSRYVGTWVGSIMTMQWVYTGAVTEDGRALHLDCEGPSFSGDGTIVPYRDIIEFLDDNHRVLRSTVQNPEGGWYEFMTTHYYRKA